MTKLDRTNCKVYEWRNTLFIARNKDHARKIIHAEYGAVPKLSEIKRFEGPFLLSYFDDERPESVSETEFVSIVAVHGDGVVSEG